MITIYCKPVCSAHAFTAVPLSRGTGSPLTCVSIVYHKAWHKQISFPWMLSEWNVLCSLHCFLPTLLFQGRKIGRSNAYGVSTVSGLVFKSSITGSPHTVSLIPAQVLSRDQLLTTPPPKCNHSLASTTGWPVLSFGSYSGTFCIILYLAIYFSTKGGFHGERNGIYLVKQK